MPLLVVSILVPRFVVTPSRTELRCIGLSRKFSRTRTCTWCRHLFFIGAQKKRTRYGGRWRRAAFSTGTYSQAVRARSIRRRCFGLRRRRHGQRNDVRTTGPKHSARGMVMPASRVEAYYTAVDRVVQHVFSQSLALFGVNLTRRKPLTPLRFMNGIHVD